MLSCRCICSAAFFHSAGFEVSYPNLLYHVFACYLTEKPLLAAIFKIHIKLFPSGYPLIWFHASLIWILPEAFFQREDLGFFVFFCFFFCCQCYVISCQGQFWIFSLPNLFQETLTSTFGCPPKKIHAVLSYCMLSKNKKGRAWITRNKQTWTPFLNFQILKVPTWIL